MFHAVLTGNRGPFSIDFKTIVPGIRFLCVRIHCRHDTVKRILMVSVCIPAFESISCPIVLFVYYSFYLADRRAIWHILNPGKFFSAGISSHFQKEQTGISCVIIIYHKASVTKNFHRLFFRCSKSGIRFHIRSYAVACMCSKGFFPCQFIVFRIKFPSIRNLFISGNAPEFFLVVSYRIIDRLLFPFCINRKIVIRHRLAKGLLILFIQIPALKGIPFFHRYRNADSLSRSCCQGRFV